MEPTPAPRALTVVLIGNPNTGKSTVFNGLSGLQSRVGNYPGVTVEKKIGRVRWDGRDVALVDLPGTYSLSPRTLDEMVAVDVLLGHQADVAAPDAVIVIVDASNLERNLYLFSQILDLGMPVVLVLNMIDVARHKGITIDARELERRIGAPVVATEGHRRVGLDGLERGVFRAMAERGGVRPDVFPEAFRLEVVALEDAWRASGGSPPERYLLERMLLDVGGQIERRFASTASFELGAWLASARSRLRESGIRIPAVEAKARYAWIRRILDGAVSHPETAARTLTDRIDHVVTHRFAGLLIFCLLMFVVFQSIYQWSEPLMGGIEGIQEWAGGAVADRLEPGPLRSLLVDGVIAGVGGVLVFLPQIALLFFFIAVFEDCGYMARAAFLMDKLMSRIGLSGKSFVPLMSSFACAIPGIMATRVIENRRDRMVTLLVAPLMSCSARLPVHLLLIGAFVPKRTYAGGLLTLDGIVLFLMMAVGAIVAVPVALLLKKTWFRGETPAFVMELPSYKWPSYRIVLGRVADRSRAFVARAGTLIFATTVLVWAAGYFPADRSRLDDVVRQIERLDAAPSDANRSARAALSRERADLAGRAIATSFLGWAGRAIEPIVRPVGWDWRIGIGVVASFPAREVIIATLGTVYSLGGEPEGEAESDVNSEGGPSGLIDALRTARWPDGRPVFGLPVALSLMVFFALCAQCASTLMVIGRETNGWHWPAFTFAYMTALAYAGAFLAFRFGTAMGW
ncbi:MAG: ferrous iron transport protein B [Planctomycetes bacterium]|nr:ferrous iron transport protein B [Planctomycetota bacterium]